MKQTGLVCSLVKSVVYSCVSIKIVIGLIMKRGGLGTWAISVVLSRCNISRLKQAQNEGVGFGQWRPQPFLDNVYSSVHPRGGTHTTKKVNSNRNRDSFRTRPKMECFFGIMGVVDPVLSLVRGYFH